MHAQTVAISPDGPFSGEGVIGGEPGSSTADEAGIRREEEVPPTRIGPFEVKGTLGKGAMGVVYLAEDVGLGRKVALKILPPALACDEELVKRFRREASLASKLEHPGIVRIYGVDESVSTHYYAMQYVEGANLREYECDFREVARIGKAVAEALAYAHREGVLHRDIKPENILINQAEGTPLIADFGLAREESVRTFTRSGQIVGTPAYMSPEQARGTSTGIDARTDQYSLGATLYELATGSKALDAPDMRALLVKIMSEDPPPLRSVRSQVPRELETIIMKSMEKDPAKRYPSCRAFADDLGRFLAGEPIEARPAGPLNRLWRKVRRHRNILAVAGFVVAAAALVGYFALEASRARTLSERERAKAETELETKYAEAMARARQALEGAAYEKAVESFVAALSVKPGDTEAERGKREARTRGLVARGRDALDRGAFEQALDSFEKAEGLDPMNRDIQNLLQEARRIGFVEIQGFDFPEELPRIETVVERLGAQSGGDEVVLKSKAPPRWLELPEGVYGLEVHIGGWMDLSLPLQVRAGQTLRTSLPLIRQDEVPEGMAFIPEGKFTSGDERLLARERELGPFFMDEREVSIGEYKRFVDYAETPDQRKWRRPAAWEAAPPPPEQDSLPVTGVTWEQAHGYARWAGKHLPSALEWEKAARGVDGRAFPWGSNFDASRCNSPLSKERTLTPVDSYDEGSSPYGVLNMAGNAAEWTSSTIEGGEEEFGDGLYKIMGGSCADAGADSLMTSAFQVADRKTVDRHVGFRCAKHFLPKRTLSDPIPFAKPDEVPRVREFRIVDDSGIEGTVRRVLRNTEPRSVPSWGLFVPYFVKIDEVRNEKGRVLEHREVRRRLQGGRGYEIRFRTPLFAGARKVLTIDMRSVLMGEPAFRRDGNRFSIRYAEFVPPGSRCQVRFILPPNAVIGKILPKPDSNLLTPAGLELFYDLHGEPKGEEDPDRKRTEREAEELKKRATVQFWIDYTREGVDLRFPEQDLFAAEREKNETGDGPFDIEREISKFSRDYVDQQGLALETLAKILRAQEKQVDRAQRRIDFRTVEILGDYVLSIESRSTKMWDVEGEIIRRKDDALFMCICTREGGRWKRLLEREAVRFDPGVVDRERKSYENRRYRCRIEPLPRWTFRLQAQGGGFGVYLRPPKRGEAMVALGGSPAAIPLKLETAARNQIETLKVIIPGLDDIAVREATLAGHPAKTFEFTYRSPFERRIVFVRQRRTLTQAHRCLFTLYEYVTARNKTALDRKWEKKQGLFDQVRRALVIE
jgi:formylglycine-generating enzyme required for sulfatase activity/predicted Ser/Thr protein kinase